jgi:signal peptidase I
MTEPTPSQPATTGKDSSSTPPAAQKSFFDSELLKTLAIAMILALTFRSLAFEPFHIPSGSMKSNLLIGDYIFVSKSSYGYGRYSFPLGLPLFSGRTGEKRPERGDVVVFRLPTDTSQDYIKRVIGLPGDTVQVTQGVVYLNGKPLPRKQVEDFVEKDERGNTTRIKRYEETLPEGKTYFVLDMIPEGEVDNTPLYTVPEGHYFMMGDNRDNSVDSRYLQHVGYVSEELLIGRAERIVLSMNDQVSVWQVTKWGELLRSGRFWKKI